MCEGMLAAVRAWGALPIALAVRSNLLTPG